MKHTLSTPAALLAIAALLLSTTVFAASGNLPGGTTLAVDITTPSNGAVIPETDPSIAVGGSAAVGQGVIVPNTLVVYVLDISGSTNPQGIGCGGDLNGDGLNNTILDCEIASALALNQQAVTLGSVGEVGVAVFAGSTDPNLILSGVPGDVGPAAGLQLVTGPDTDANASGGRDVEEVLRTARAVSAPALALTLFAPRTLIGNLTNYAAGIQAALDIVAASTMPNKLVFFMSDGLSNVGPHVLTLGPAVVASGAIFNTFAVGSAANITCDALGSAGSLRQVAQLSNPDGQCYEVSAVAQLPNILPAVLQGTLSRLELAVDGGPATDISGAATPALPQTGPASVTYGASTANLAPGAHQLCVTALGSDAGGPGSLTDCVAVTVNAQPDADAGGPHSGFEGTALALGGAATDPEGDPLAVGWTVDSLLCSFDDPGVLNPNLTCGDNGSFNVTLSVSDGINLPVTSSASVTVSNLPPTVDAGPDQSVVTGATVNLSGSFSDPAAAADNPYTYAWDLDGDSLADDSGNVNYGSPIPASTSFGATGVYVLTLTVTDKDGASSSDTVTISVNAAPVCTAAAPSQSTLWPANHTLAAIDILGVTDPDGDAVTITIASIFQDEPTNGLGDGDTSPDGFGIGAATAQVRAERAGSGNGRFYHISFTAADPYGATCAGTVHVSVPKSQGKGGAAVDDGALFDSTLP